MLVWQRIEAGEYLTEGGRFKAYRAYDRVYGEHWILCDTSVDDYYRKCAGKPTV